MATKKSGIRKLFGGIYMSWTKVIIFAVLAGAFTALMMLVPAFNNTSMQDIATYLDCWVLFAIIIIVNCKKWWEASLKTFVFFLISQPLVYLIQVPFVSLGWKIFMYYKFWFIMTLLTLPGAAIAFLIKKNNYLSVAVLSVANAYYVFAAVAYFKRAINHFPYHIFSAFLCIFLAIFITCMVFRTKKLRNMALTIAGTLLAVAIVACFMGIVIL